MRTSKKIISIILSVILLMAILPMGTFADRMSATYAFDSFTVTDAPSALNIQFFDGPDTRGFTWFTTKDVTETVLYLVNGLVGETYDFETEGVKYDGECESYKDPEQYKTEISIHKVMIRGLQDARTYSYKLGGNGKYVYGSFKVDLNDEKIVAINFTDPQTQDPKKLNYWENCVKTAMNYFGDDADFILHDGDLLDSNLKLSDYPQLYNWAVNLQTMTKYTGSLPFVMATGNHEANLEKLWVKSNNINFAGYAASNTSAYYSYDYGNTHFVVLAYFGNISSDKFTAEMTWLESDLKANNENPETKWTVVLTHNGPYTTGDHKFDERTSSLTKALCPILSEYHVDLVIQGHDHTYSKTLPYYWDANGYAASQKSAAAAINYDFVEETINGIVYQVDGNGTYYVSCGSSGHRNDENNTYSNPETGKWSSSTPVVDLGTTLYTTKYATAGNFATGTLSETAFGVLTISGDVLVYDFYVADADGVATKIDSLNMFKGTTSDKEIAENYEGRAASVNNDSANALYREYMGMTPTQKALIKAETVDKVVNAYKGIVESVIKKTLVVEKDKASIAAVQVSDVKDGKVSVRIVASIPKHHETCGVEVRLENENVDSNAFLHDFTEVYTNKVNAMSEYGFGEIVNDSEDSYLAAVTIKDIIFSNFTLQLKACVGTIDMPSETFGKEYSIQFINGIAFNCEEVK